MEFLRPTKAKIILSSALAFIFVASVYIYSAGHILVCTSTGCPSVEDVAMKTTLNSIIPALISSYLISCIMIFAYYKARYKNKKNIEKKENKEPEIKKIKEFIEKVKKMAEIRKSGIRPVKR